MFWIFHHWGLPLAACIFWWGMLIALMVCWAAQGKPIYSFVSDGPGDHRKLLYISDISATNLQPIFIACSGAQGLCFVLALVSERYLRHAGRLLPNWTHTEKVLAGFSIAFGILGQLGILFVAIFNTKVFPHVHVGMLCVFIVCVGISVLFTIAEFILLDHSYHQTYQLRASYMFKIFFFFVALALAIAFAVLGQQSKPTAAAGCEWAISFFYGFYLLNLSYDLYPAASTSKGQLLEKKMTNQLDSALHWSLPVENNPNIPHQPPLNANEPLETSPVGDKVLSNRQSIPSYEHDPDHDNYYVDDSRHLV